VCLLSTVVWTPHPGDVERHPDGVLRLELRKVEAAKPRRIQISGS
jgi:hypothetical protein